MFEAQQFHHRAQSVLVVEFLVHFNSANNIWADDRGEHLALWSPLPLSKVMNITPDPPGLKYGLTKTGRMYCLSQSSAMASVPS